MSLFRRKPDPEPVKKAPQSPPKPKRAPKAKGKTPDLTTRGTPRIRKDYTEAERERALLEVAANAGNCRAAERNLTEDGLRIDHSVLYDWSRKRHAARYEAIREELLPKIQAEQADAHRALARRQVEGSLQGVELIVSRLPQMENRDLINATGKLDIGSGIHDEKALLLDGQPTVIHGKRDASEILRTLKQRHGVSLTIEAEVVEEEDVVA